MLSPLNFSYSLFAHIFIFNKLWLYIYDINVGLKYCNDVVWLRLVCPLQWTSNILKLYNARQPLWSISFSSLLSECPQLLDSTSTHLCFCLLTWRICWLWFPLGLSQFQTELILLCQESLLGGLHGNLNEFA